MFISINQQTPEINKEEREKHTVVKSTRKKTQKKFIGMC
jgi:hypothetical protein